MVALAGSTELSAVSIYQVDVIIRLLSNSLTSLFSEILPSSPSSESIGDDDLFGNGESGTYPQSDNDSKSRCNVALSLFEECIGVLIDISKTSYIELPSLERLAVSVHVINPQCDDVFIQRYAFLDDIISKSISTLSHHEGVMTITELPHDGTGVPVVFTVARSVKDTTAKPAVGISLYRLLHLHPSAKILKDLIKLFLDMPFWLLKSEKAKIMLPWNLLVSYRPEKGSLSINYRFDDASADVNTFELQHNHDVENSAFRNNKKSIFGIQYGRSMDWTTSASEKDDAAIAIFEKTRSHFMFDIISEELASKPGDTAAGKFSFVEHNSGYGFLSALVSEAYPNATVISLESDDNAVSHHVEMLEHLSLHNNAVCKKRKGEDSLMYKNLYESPELFRFQVMSQGFLESFRDADNLFRWGADTGSLLSTALTTFINLPTSEIASLSMHLFFGSFDKSTDGFGRGPIRPLKELFGEETSGFLARDVRDVSDIFQTANLNIGGNLDGKQCKAHSNLQVSSRKVIMDDVGDKLHVWGHPSRLFEEFESSLLLIHSRALAGNTKVKFNTLYYGESKLKSPMIRVDIINMTRGVHHHYDYAKDGHKRTYTMRVMVNETQTSEIFSLYGSPSKAASVPTRNEIKLVFYSNGLSNTMSLPLGSHPNADSIVTVNLMRASTIPFYIPYTSIYGVTLITALRLGLETSQRDKMFSSFINLPLYEDMAPWNIVLMGQGLDYIDYDTRDITFDKFVPKAYQVMAVLMNYKRTVEDFKRCGAKASTVYGIAFISDCVGNVKGLKCEELSHAVPCPDGECHTDYISCLRSLTYQASKISDEGSTDSVLSEMVAAMASQTGQFDENGMVIH